MSENNLVKHARLELERAGYFKEDGLYGSMLGHSTMKLIEVFAAEGHSGSSAWIQVELFKRLASFEALSPLTNAPDEWTEVGTGVWQSNRESACFSNDGGKTYYSIDDQTRTVKTAEVYDGPK